MAWQWSRLSLLGVAVSCAGCLPQYKPPKPVVFDPATIQSIDIAFVGGAQSYCIYERAPQLRIVVTTSDGKRLSTPALGESQRDHIAFDQFELGSDFGSFDGNGSLSVGGDPFEHLGRTIQVNAAVVERPELKANASISAQFGCGPVVSASGASGRSGFSGQSGSTGQAGSSGNSSRAATEGANGDHGGPGADGEHGQNGGTIAVYLSYVDTAEVGRLVLAKVSGRLYLFAPGGPGIVALAEGGSGGSGGAGGSGGSGGPGGSNNIQDAGDGADGGDGGDGGQGGNGGDGGAGGEIQLYYDSRFPELKAELRGSTAGGRGGSGGTGGSPGAAGTGGRSASGNDGRAGQRGRQGPSGRPGRQGPDGQGIRVEAAAVEQIFTNELRAGLPIAQSAS